MEEAHYEPSAALRGVLVLQSQRVPLYQTLEAAHKSYAAEPGSESLAQLHEALSVCLGSFRGVSDQVRALEATIEDPVEATRVRQLQLLEKEKLELAVAAVQDCIRHYALDADAREEARDAFDARRRENKRASMRVTAAIAEWVDEVQFG
jgi:hypothetical protein